MTSDSGREHGTESDGGAKGPRTIRTLVGSRQVVLRVLTVRDWADLATLDVEKVDDRELAVRLLHHQIVEPSVDVAEVRGWDDAALLETALRWAGATRSLANQLPSDVASFSDFRAGWLSFLEERRRLTREAVARLADPLARIREQIARITLPRLDWALPTTRITDQLTADIARIQNISRVWLIDYINTQKILQEMVSSPLRDLQEHMNALLTPFTEAIGQIQESQRLIAELVVPRFDVGQLFPKLPDLTKLIEQYEEFEKSREVLRNEGFEFTEHLWDIAFIISLSGIDPRVQSAEVTRRLLSVTRSASFGEELRDSVLSSSGLRRRWPVVWDILSAHTDRRYILSVPCLLAQVEGVFSDMLVLKAMAVSEGGRLYARAKDGSKKLGRQGRPIELTGLSRKIYHSKFRNHPVLSIAVYAALDKLVPDRNQILHGQLVLSHSEIDG